MIDILIAAVFALRFSDFFQNVKDSEDTHMQPSTKVTHHLYYIYDI